MSFLTSGFELPLATHETDLSMLKAYAIQWLLVRSSIPLDFTEVFCGRLSRH